MFICCKHKKTKNMHKPYSDLVPIPAVIRQRRAGCHFITGLAYGDTHTHIYMQFKVTNMVVVGPQEGARVSRGNPADRGKTFPQRKAQRNVVPSHLYKWLCIDTPPLSTVESSGKDVQVSHALIHVKGP